MVTEKLYAVVFDYLNFGYRILLNETAETLDEEGTVSLESGGLSYDDALLLMEDCIANAPDWL